MSANLFHLIQVYAENVTSKIFRRSRAAKSSSTEFPTQSSYHNEQPHQISNIQLFVYRCNMRLQRNNRSYFYTRIMVQIANVWQRSAFHRDQSASQGQKQQRRSTRTQVERENKISGHPIYDVSTVPIGRLCQKPIQLHGENGLSEFFNMHINNFGHA